MAEILSRFEAELNVGERLSVHSGGNISAKVRYHKVEVECGGEISGDIQAQPQPMPSPAIGVSRI